jgi:hypothetical protein
MKKLICPFLLLIMSPWVLCGCGIKGPLVAPVIKLPQKVTELKSLQRGEHIILNWKNPDSYTDDSPLTDIDSIEIWMLEEKIEDEETNEKISKDRFLEEASLLTAMTPVELINAAKDQNEVKADKEEKKAAGKPATEKKDEEKVETETTAAEERITPEKFEYRHKLSLDEMKKKNYSFALRVKDEKDKYSEFTDPVSIITKIIPLPPTDLKTQLYADRVVLSWTPPEKNIDGSFPAVIAGYNVYQVNEEGEPVRINPYFLTPREAYSIYQIEFGEIYQYFIRASATPYPYYESDNSDIVEIEVKDIFPPAPPEGLVSIIGEDFVSLSWAANQEKDIAGYKVWRKKEGEDQYKLLTPDPITEIAYNDYGIKKNIVYLYAVSALDQNNNESSKSKDLRVILRNLNNEDLPF